MPKKYNNIDVKKAQQLYESGMTLAEVGKHFGVNPQAISHRFYEAGIATRGTLHDNEWFEVEKAIELYVDKGFSLQDTADQLWVSQGKVKKELLKAGCTLSAKRSRRSRKKLTEGENDRCT